MINKRDYDEAFKHCGDGIGIPFPLDKEVTPEGTVVLTLKPHCLMARMTFDMILGIDLIKLFGRVGKSIQISERRWNANKKTPRGLFE